MYTCAYFEINFSRCLRFCEHTHIAIKVITTPRTNTKLTPGVITITLISSVVCQLTPIVTPPKKWTYRAVTWCQFEPYDLTVRIDNADFLFAGSYTHGSFLTLSWGASGLKTLWMIFDQQSLTFPHSQSHGFSSCSWMEMLLKLVLNDFTRACKDGIFGNPKGAVR